MLFRLTLALELALAVSAFADTEASRAKLIGSWQVQEASAAGPATVWSLEHVGDGIRLTESKEGQTVSELECNTVGKECTVKDSGHKVKVSMWYNGPKLVEIETRGSEVVKRRFSVAESGDNMEMELIPITPSGKAETFHLKRTQLAAAH